MHKNLIVVGDKIDSLMFSLTGAKTFKIDKTEQLETVFNYCNENLEKVASVLIANKFYDEDNKFFKKLESLELPLVNITGGGIGGLLEKTIGMKLGN